MARTTRVLGSFNTRSRRTKKLITAAVTVVFFGLMGSPAIAGGQGFGQSPGSFGQNPQRNRIPDVQPPNFPRPNEKQKQALLDYNYKKMKKHAKDLAELAKSLQKEIEKSNENVLSLEIVKKAEEVEKLAKKIKNEAKGY